MNFKKFFVRKSIQAIQAESNSTTLKRTLSAANLISLGIGAIIGAGIFVLTGKAAAQHAGPAITLSFCLAGMACVFAAFCYAEMASLLPVSGSAYTYSYASLGEIFAWAMGLLLVLEYGVASATVAVGWSGYVVSFLKDFGITLSPQFTQPMGQAILDANGTAVIVDGKPLTAIFNFPAFLIVALTTILLTIGVKESAKINNIIVFIKISVVLVFVAIGIFYVDPSNWTPFIPENIGVGQFGYEGILKAAGVIFFAYIGFEAISTAAQETVNPQRNVPIGILGSLVICTLLYVLVSGVLTGVVPYSLLDVPDPMAVAVDTIGLGWLSFLIKVGAIMGLSSVILVMMYGQTRVFYMISRDGLLPEFFSKIHKKFQTPHFNTMIVGLIVGVAAGVTPISTLGDLVSMGTLFAFTIVCVSVLYLRYKEPKLDRPFRCPWVPFIPLAGIASCLYLIYGIGWHVFVTLKIYFIIGIFFYFVYGQFRSKLQQNKS